MADEGVWRARKENELGPCLAIATQETMSLSHFRFFAPLSVVLALSASPLLYAAPVAVDDVFTTDEDRPLASGNVSSVIVQADFEAASSVVAGPWQYLDKMGNQFSPTPATYPVDAGALDWKSLGFDTATSTVGPWGVGALPLQGGGIAGMPAGTPSTLTGMTGGPNNEYLVTTYLFRKVFNLTAAEAAQANWSLRYIIDDGAIIYLNGQEVERFRMEENLLIPAGPVTTQTAVSGSSDENTYVTKTVNLAGKLVPGPNVIAVEVHQTHGGNFSSSDVGLDLTLAGDQSDGFVLAKDAFGTNQPNFENGSFLTGANGNTTQVAGVDVGRIPFGTPAASSSAAWRHTFTLSAPTTVDLSFSYRLLMGSRYENSEYAMAVAELSGERLGAVANPVQGGTFVLASFRGDGNNGPAMDTAWRTASFTRTLPAGTHTVNLGIYNNGSSEAADGESAQAYFDDVQLSSQGGSAGVLVNDTEAATAALVTQPSKGTLVFNPDGSFLYTPTQHANGSDTFTYTVSDGVTTSAPATVTINITPINDAPVAANNTYNIQEDVVLTRAAPGVLGNDTDVEGQTLTAAIVATTTNGQLQLNANGGFTYTPNQDYFGTDTFTYRASDGGANSNTATVTLNIANVDDPPVPGPAEQYTLPRGQTFTIASPIGGTVSEDLVLSAVRNPDNTIGTPGSLWKYWDRGPLSAPQEAAWKTLAMVDADWAEAASELGYGDASEGYPEATLINDNADTAVFDPGAGDKYITTYFRKKLNIARVSEITGLTLEVSRDDGVVIYLNEQEAYRTAVAANPTFTTGGNSHNSGGAAENLFFNANDVGTGINQNWTGVPPTPALLVEGENILAAEIHQTNGSSSDVGFDLRLRATRQLPSGLLANDTDDNGPANLTARVVTQPARGTLQLNANGTFSYTPNAGVVGADSFVYEIFDGTSASAPVTVTLNIVSVGNTPPTAMNDEYNATEDTTLSVPIASGVLANDADEDAEVMAAQVLTQPTNGSLVLNTDGSFAYTPSFDWHGTDSFTYRVVNSLNSTPATVTIVVAPVNDAPRTVADTYGTNPGVTLVVAPNSGVLGNDSDAEGAPLTATLVSNPETGVLTFNADGSFTYVPAGLGTVSFTYTTSDGTLSSVSTTVTIVVDELPVATPESYTGFEDATFAIPAPGVLGNDTSPANRQLTAQLVSAPSVGGTFSLQANGSFTFTPPASWSGSTSFSYRAYDGFRASADTTVTLVVAPADDFPKAGFEGWNVPKDLPFTIAAPGLLGNDTDEESQPLTASLGSPPSFGTVLVNANGSFTYTPQVGFTGKDSFVYRVSDGTNSTMARVELDIKDVASLVIHEVMFRPAATFPEPVNREWIELRNLSAVPVSLAGWQFTAGVDYVFPANASIPANGFLIVTANVTAFQAAHPTVPNVVGGWIGGLSNRGENIVLRDPAGLVVDEVDYASEGDWATRTFTNTIGYDWSILTKDQGRSIELRNPTLSNDNGQNWQASAVAGGTPGAVNAANTANIAPIIKGVRHSPAIPTPTDKILISCELNDESYNALLSANVVWRNATTASPPAWTTTALSTDGKEGWFACLPNQVDGTIIEFYISATDGTNTRTWPSPAANGQEANCHLQVSSEAATTRDTARLILTGAENAAFENTAATNTGSNRQFHCTVIHTRGTEENIRYRSAFRIRGNGSRSYKFKPMRLSLPVNEPLYGLTGINLNPKNSFSQYFGNRLGSLVGLRMPHVIPVELRRNGVEYTDVNTNSGATPDFGMWVMIEDYNGEWVDNHFPAATGGNIYKNSNSNRYWQTLVAPGNPNTVVNGWSKQNNGSTNDWSDLAAFGAAWQANAAPHFPGSNPEDVAQANGGRLTGLGVWDGTAFTPAEYASLNEVANFSQWARWFAFMTILQSNETNLSSGVDDDYGVFIAPEEDDGIQYRRVHLLSHDLDTIFGMGDSPLAPNARTLYDSTGNGTTTSDCFRSILPLLGNTTTTGNAEFRTLYFNALREMFGGVLNADTTTGGSNPAFYRLVDQHLEGWVPADVRTALKNFASQRQTYLLEQMSANAIPPPVPTVSTIAQGARGAVFISEVLALNSTIAVDGRFPDIIELRNTGAAAFNLAGMSLSDDPLVKAKYVFPAGTTIPANGFLTVYADADPAITGLRTGFSLSAKGETVVLYNTLASGQAQIDSCGFGLQIPDHSIGRTGANTDVWTLCTPTIGAANTAVTTFSPVSGLRINEWLANAEFRATSDFVEIYNPGASPAALGGLSVTPDHINLPRLGTIRSLSFIAPNGFVAFEARGDKATPGDASELAIELKSSFGNISLLGSNLATIDMVDIISQSRDTAQGRLPDASTTLVRLDIPTPGTSNSGTSQAELDVLNHLRIVELMYQPNNGSPEFIEFQNTSFTATLNLGGVRFESGITFTFAAGTTLAPGGRAVITANQAEFANHYPGVATAGVFTGRLDNNGESLRMVVSGVATLIQEFGYQDSWHPATAGQGASLNIRNPMEALYLWDEAIGWQSSPPTPGSAPTFSVYAGADTTATAMLPIALDGDVLLGTQNPNTLALSWTLQSGPAGGTAQFTAANCTETTATFTKPGIYTLRLAAAPPAGQGTPATDTMQVIVEEDYASWAAVALANEPNSRQPSQDPDKDGVVNLLEYVTGSSPTVPNQVLTPVWEDGRLVAYFTRSVTAARYYRMRVENSADLSAWATGEFATAETAAPPTVAEPGLEYWKTEDVSGATQDGRLFFRLAVEGP